MKTGHERPVNSTAARVVARGESFAYRQLETEICSSVPLPMKDSGEYDDLSGRKLGRLKVLGRYDANKNRWVCKCLCGNYCVRSAIAIAKQAPDAACAQCYLQAVSRRHEYERRTGKHKDTSEFM